MQNLLFPTALRRSLNWLDLSARTQEVRFAFSLLLLLFTSACQTGREDFVLGIYSVPQADLQSVHDAGFHLVTGPAEREYLNAARDAGVKVLASVGTSAGPNFQSDRARLTTQRFDSHPALWGWCLADEPDLNRISPDQVISAHRFLKNMGVRKPTVSVIYRGGEAQNYGAITDITMIDRYPIPWLPLASMTQHLQMGRLALGKKKPLIAVLQAFDWRSFPDLSPAGTNTRPPSYEELRCMTYCALGRNANGIFYYCFDSGGWRMSQQPSTWSALKSVVAEVNAYRPLFEAEHPWWPCVHQYPKPENRFNAALDSSIISTLLRVYRGNAAVASGDYLLLINTTERPIKYWFMPPKRLSSIDVFGEGRSLIASAGWFEEEFNPFAVHIYGPIR